MTSATTKTAPPQAWWKSKRLLGLCFVLAGMIAQATGVSDMPSDAETAQLADYAALASEGIGGIIILASRIIDRGRAAKAAAKSMLLCGLMVGALAVSACAGGRIDYRESVLIGCRAYVGTLNVLAVMLEEDRLSEAQEAVVDEWEPVLGAICEGDAPPADADTADLIDRGVRALLAVEAAARQSSALPLDDPGFVQTVDARNEALFWYLRAAAAAEW